MKKSIIALFLCANYANASGLLLQEAATANAGTVGAGDGVYTESAAASWINPATMSYMGEDKFTINAMFLDLQMDYEDYGTKGELPDYTPTGDTDAQTVMPALGVFYARQVTDNLHLGINIGGTGGSSIDYGTQWDGANHLVKANMSILQVNPNMSYKVSDKLSIGFGGQISYAILEVSTTGIEIDEGDDFSYGYTAGLMYQEEHWALGLSYRSKVVHEFSDMSVTSLMDPPIESIVGTELITPSIIDISGRLAVTPTLSLLSSIQLHRWSEYPETPVYHDKLNSLEGAPQSINREWEDTWKYAIGAEYLLNQNWTLKAGFAYETAPQDDPTKQWVDFPVGESYRYSLGAKTKWHDTVVDVFYEYADLGTVEIDRTGKAYTQIYGGFEGQIHFFGVNFTF
ncbi:OmpP1/FadL family transporter [Thalassotalea atypica]|uniref:OmpP1/FadL family transporter n=1 Tax=Thalassotalea atypica TaxID=2054316 RepID=UPI002572B1D4|nr:outer membrane protein transport protein [Thalassotalea atypica]